MLSPPPLSISRWTHVHARDMNSREAREDAASEEHADVDGRD